MTKNHPINQKLEEALKNRAFSGASLSVIHGEKVLFNEIYGQAQIVPKARELTKESLFDIASLTKPVCTVTLMMLALQEKKCSLKDLVESYFPQIKIKGIRIENLLNHTSGLPAWKPYHEELQVKAPGWMSDEKGKEWIVEKVLNENPEAPIGKQVIYSDIGFILLGVILEKIYEKELDILFKERIATPLKMEKTFFNPLDRHKQMIDSNREDFVATEDCPWRKTILCGEVMDDTAYAMGGVAGHAGLFSTAEGLIVWVRELQNARRGKGTLIKKETFELFCKIPPSRDPSVPFFTLGFDTPGTDSTAGKHFSLQSIGHLAFTGCSFWWDLEKDVAVILLTNRVHPTRKNQKIKTYRPKIHDVVMESLNLV